MGFVICAIIKDELLYLEEWVLHHLNLGFNHIYLFEDFGSKSHKYITDKYDLVILDTCDSYLPIKRDYDRGDMRQLRLYQKFLNEHRNLGWCAFIDIDEFIFLDNSESLETIAENYKDLNGVAVYWKMYGANGKVCRPQLSINDSYTKQCGTLLQDVGWNFKSFVNMNIAKEFRYLHDIIGLCDINRNRVVAGSCSPIYDKIWINHYYTKSFEDWLNRFKRGDLMPNHRKFYGFFELNPEFNDRISQYCELYENGCKDIDSYKNIVIEKESSNVPKQIFYCWFGKSKLPVYALRAIESWKKYLPDYKIILIDETNFDVNKYYYTKNAYKNRLYAFVSDFVRVWAIYNFGGLYFDTDVELIKPIDDLIENGSFMGFEKPIYEGAEQSVASGLIMCGTQYNHFYGQVLSKFIMSKNPTVQNCLFYSEILKLLGLKDNDSLLKFENITVYPAEYFCPVDLHGNMKMTDNTRSIHWYSNNWSNKDNVLKVCICDFWKGFNFNESIIYEKLSNYYTIVFDDKSPQLVIYSVFGNDHAKYDGIPKLCISGECRSDDTTFVIDTTSNNSCNHLYAPYIFTIGTLYSKYAPIEDLLDRKLYNKTDFCGYLTSSKHDNRDLLFLKISNDYKLVNSGGSNLNNIGYTVQRDVKSHREFLQKHKFFLSLENELCGTYITEKIFMALANGCVPIYRGGSNIEDIINPECFINANNLSDELVIEAIKLIDLDDSLYNKMITAPIFNNNWYENFQVNFDNFIKLIVDTLK